MEILQIPSPWPKARCFHLASSASTMQDARELVRSGCPGGSVVAADFQSAGRGRIEGRRWLSPPGENLMFTLVLPPEAAAETAFPLRAGLALVRAIDGMEWVAEPCGDEEIPPIPRALLKWPNDIVMEGKKLAGILCEAGSGAVLVGVGINANQTRFDPALGGNATSLRLLSGCAVDRWKLLSRFLFELEAVRAEALWKEAIEAYLWRRGDRVDFLPGRAFDSPGEGSSPGQARSGILEGIDEEGGLVLSVPGEGRRSYFSGEIRLLSAYPTL
jgi:BirA family biotin operon repressor/biotin-[acetyl-CoA-carboxylase] ligase